MDSDSAESDLESDFRESDIHVAIEQLDVERVRRLVGGSGDVEEEDRHGTTPLVKAVQMDNLEMVDLLLELGAGVNAPFSVDDPEASVFNISLKNALSYAIVRISALRWHKLELTPVRHQIIKRLIDSGSDLDVAPQFQHMYISPLQNACQGRLWPVILDLIEAGSKVDINGRHHDMPLVTAASVADRTGQNLFDDAFEDEDWSLVGPSRKRALDVLLEKSPTLRLVTTYGSLFKQVIDGCSARVLCILLKVDKPAYGVDEAVDVLNYAARSELVDIAEANQITLDYNKLPHGFRCCPLQISIMYLLQRIYSPFPDAMRTLRYIRRQFAVLRLLLGARANACQLDGNFKQFLQLIRHRLNTNYSHFPQDILTFCNQILDAVESNLHNPQQLVEICRARVRHELNIRGLCVHHIRDSVNRIVENYLLYSDLPQPEEYLVYKYIGD